MDTRAFLLLAVLLGGLMGWTFFMQPPAPPVSNSQAAIDSSYDDPSQGASAAPSEAVKAEESAEDAAETGSVTVRTPGYVAVFQERGGRLSSFKLLDYYKRKLHSDSPDEPMELVTMPNPLDWPLRLNFTDTSAPNLANALFHVDKKELNLQAGESGELTMTYRSAEGLTVTRTLIFNADTFLIHQKVTVDNQSSESYDGYLTMRLNSAPFDTAYGRYNEMGAYLNNALELDSPQDAAETLADYRGQLTSVDWIGYMDPYFLTAHVIDNNSDNPEALPPSLSAAFQDHGGLAIGVSKPLNLAAGQRSSYDFHFYYGPKSDEALKAAGHHLDKSVDLGWFSFLAVPLAALLRWIYSWVGNYGVAIIIVTILIKLAMWPLTAKSYQSMKQMQKLQPKVMKLREKYSNDKETMQREIMQLYKTFKVNPLGGCLPMLLQIPFFIAFYRVLYSMLELRGAPFMLWIQDLAAPDRLFSFNFTIPFFEPPTGIPVLTLLMGASMIFQQKMTPNTMGDPLQAKMMMLMPIVFTFILINMPAGLVLYWLVNNILSIAQQLHINCGGKEKAAA